MWKRVRRIRGGGVRAAVVILAFVACSAVVGAAIAAGVQRRVYRSTGRLQVQRSMPAVMGPDRHLEDFEAFKGAQVTMILSSPMMEMAIQDPVWARAGGRPTSADDLRRRVSAASQVGSEVIEVSATASDPKAAAAGVSAVIRGYRQLSSNIAGSVQLRRLRNVEQRRADLASEVQSLTSYLATFGEGVGDLEPLYGAAVRRLNRLDDAILDMRMSRPPTTQPATTTTTTHPSAATRSVDAREHSLLTLREDARGQVGDLNARLRQQRSLEARLDEAQAELAKVRQRVMVLRDEPLMDEWVVVLSSGEEPTAPESRWAGRRVRIAAGMGAGSGLLVAMVIGLLRSRVAQPPAAGR